MSFTIDAGETYGLIGPNGAGKTTIISMISGLVEPSSGRVLIAGKPTGPHELEAKANVGLVPQELAIYPDLTARENLMFFGRLARLSGATLRERVDEVLMIIGLQDRADDRSGTYSGGMKRRLNIGIGLLHRPTLLILDEPTVGVDPQSRNSILESVAALSGEGMAVLYTTHYMEEAERLCDRIGIIDKGVMQAEGTQDELLRITGEVDEIVLRGVGPIGEVAERVASLEGVSRVDTQPRTLVVTIEEASTMLARVIDTAASSGMTVADVEITRPDLESVFLHLTGRGLRD